KFVTEKENIYDEVNQLDRVPIRENNYGYLEPKQDLNQERAMAEHLPLINAGTFNGLPSENPNDFVDRYNIAAKSNSWTEEN
uniref:hypothetical protein n=1 Tax=Klebsiella pneumoniae TaxID=573 RepID=UPI00163DC3E9